MGMVVVGGLLITATYYAMQRKVVPKVQALQKVRPAHPTQRPWQVMARACAGAGCQGCSLPDVRGRSCEYADLSIRHVPSLVSAAWPEVG